MANKLDGATILRLMREERVRQLTTLREGLTKGPVEGEDKRLVAPGLKLRSKGDGILHTVKAVGPDSVVLLDPRGNTVQVSDADLERGYDRD